MIAGITQGLKNAAGALSGMLGGSTKPHEPDFGPQLKAMGFGYRDEVVKFVDDEYTRRLQEQQPWHLQWRLIIDFLNSYQFRMVDETSGTIRDVPAPNQWASRRINNQMLPTTVVRQSKLSRARPILKARPNSGEQRDIATAKTSWKVLQANEADQEWPARYTDLTTWLLWTGNVATKDTWDKSRGRLIGRMEQPAPEGHEPPAEGEQPAVQVRDIREGDVMTMVRSPFGILPDSPWRADVEQCRSILEAMVMPVDEIYQTYGVMVQPEKVETVGVQQAIVAPGAPSAGAAGGFRLGPITVDNAAVVKEYWERPSAKYPEGRFIVVANKTLLYIGPLPYRCGPDNTPDLPYTIWKDINVPGCFWGKAVNELLVPLQRELNDIYNEKRDYRRRLAHGQVIVEKGSVDLDDVEANAGRHDYVWVVERGTSFLPKPMDWGDRATVFERDEAAVNNQWTLISGVSEMARKSEAPAGVKSGVALSIATEQDDTRLAATLENITQASIKSGKKRIRLYKQFATGPRIARYVGADNQVEALQWEASDLTSEDLFVENSSALSESPAQRRQMVFDMYREGMFSDPQTGKLNPAGRQKLFEMLQLGNWEDGTDTDALQASKQDREIRLILQGGMPVPAEFDDDLMHMSRLVRYMLSAEWDERLQQPDGPQVQANMMAHYEAHMQRMAEKMAQEMAAMAPQTAPAPQ